MTSLFNGDRVPKINARVEAYGTLDELNSWCGYARSISDDTEIDKSLTTIQKFLHRLCSDLATPVSGDNESNPVPRITDDVRLRRTGVPGAEILPHRRQGMHEEVPDLGGCQAGA